MERTFEDYLAEKHADQYIGVKDGMVDNFNEWLCDLSTDEWIQFGDFYAQITTLKAVKECLNDIQERMDRVFSKEDK